MADDEELEMVEVEIELEEDLVQELEELADELGITFDEFVRQLVRAQLDREI